MQSTISSVRKQSLVPLYMQIADALLEQINTELLKPYDKLPSELELTRLYKASRVTIRLAVKRLIAQGVVASRQGKGTFVLEPVIKHELGEFKGFYDQLKIQGVNPETELLSFTIDPADLPAEASGLVGTGKHIIEFVRQYKVHTHAFAEVHAWFASNSIPKRELLEKYPVLGIVIREFGSAISSAELGIRAVSANAKLARNLEIKKTSPILLLRRASFLSNKKLCEYSEIHIRAERYEFRLKTESPLSVTSAIHNLGKPKTGSPRLVYPVKIVGKHTK
jgi:GntR family transcriptional regulator